MTTKAELRRQLAVERQRGDNAWKMVFSHYQAEQERISQKIDLDIAWERVQELQTALAEATDEINHRTVSTAIYDMVLEDLQEARDRSEALQSALDDLERAASARWAYQDLEPYSEVQEAADRAAEILTSIVPPPPSLNWPTHSGFTKILNLKIIIKRDWDGNFHYSSSCS